MVYDVAVAGGGAAGLSAAITAAKRNKKVVILEKNDRIGKKLLATGNGRCNLASALSTKNRFNTDAVEEVFARVPLSRVFQFFADLGLVIREESGRYYPYSNQASSVLNALRKGIADIGAEVRCSSKICNIYNNKNFVLDTESGLIEARNVVFATGSEAGGGQNSLHLLQGFGHKIVQSRPALVPLLTDTSYLKGLRGVRARVKATIYADGNAVKTVTDEILFKDNGVTGTAVFELSTALARQRYAKKVVLALDFAPEYSHSELAELFRGKMGLEGVFHKEIAANMIRYASKQGKQTNAKAYADAAKNLIIEVKGLSSFSLAQVASGGLEISGFDFTTMESKLCKGLFAAGEALDVDGDCGGFNLMWAWASGILAGESVQ